MQENGPQFLEVTRVGTVASGIKAVGLSKSRSHTEQAMLIELKSTQMELSTFLVVRTISNPTRMLSRLNLKLVFANRYVKPQESKTIIVFLKKDYDQRETTI